MRGQKLNWRRVGVTFGFWLFAPVFAVLASLFLYQKYFFVFELIRRSPQRSVHQLFARRGAGRATRTNDAKARRSISSEWPQGAPRLGSPRVKVRHTRTALPYHWLAPRAQDRALFKKTVVAVAVGTRTLAAQLTP